MPAYRAPMRSRHDDVDPALAVERALERGLVGVGGRLRAVPRSLEDAVACVADEHDERTAARLARFAAVEVGAQVWTRDGDGLFHVGVVTGDWYYDEAPQAWESDLVHVRACTWATPSDLVPDAVLVTFARGGRNFQRIRDLP